MASAQSTEALLDGIDWEDGWSPTGEAREGLDEPCSICFSEQLRDQLRAGALGELNCCTHTFCFECIRRWCEECSRCPLCKREVGEISRSNPRQTLETVRVAPKEQKAPELTEEELQALAAEEDASYNCVVCNSGEHEVPPPLPTARPAPFSVTPIAPPPTAPRAGVDLAVRFV
jgi:hypothetical protein